MRTAETNAELVEIVKYRADQYLGGGVRSPEVLDAMRRVDRAAFVPHWLRWAAYFDEPVSIGHGQTCSQPSMVAFMLDKLGVKSGDRVLEVGAGCGYAAAVAVVLCAPEGVVYASEILPELAAAARSTCATTTFAAPGRAPEPLADRMVFIEGDGSAGFPERGPFDRILLSAGVSSPTFREEPLLEQLAEGGTLVYPQAHGSLYRLTKRGNGILRDRWYGVAFVPLKGRNS